MTFICSIGQSVAGACRSVRAVWASAGLLRAQAAKGRETHTDRRRRVPAALRRLPASAGGRVQAPRCVRDLQPVQRPGICWASSELRPVRGFIPYVDSPRGDMLNLFFTGVSSPTIALN